MTVLREQAAAQRVELAAILASTHDAIIGHPDGSWVRTSKGTRYLALRPTLAERHSPC